MIKKNNAFTLMEVLITVFLISLITSILFATFDSLKKNIRWTEEEALNIREEDKILNFITYSIKYLYHNELTEEIITYERKTDYLNNRRDNIKLYSTYPLKTISNLKISNEEEFFTIYNKTNNDTIVFTDKVSEFQVNFYKNENIIQTFSDNVFAKNEYDYIEVIIIINENKYNYNIKPFILF